MLVTFPLVQPRSLTPRSPRGRGPGASDSSPEIIARATVRKIALSVASLSSIAYWECARSGAFPETEFRAHEAAAKHPLRLDRRWRYLPDTVAGRRRALRAGHPDGAVRGRVPLVPQHHLVRGRRQPSDLRSDRAVCSRHDGAFRPPPHDACGYYMYRRWRGPDDIHAGILAIDPAVGPRGRLR